MSPVRAGLLLLGVAPAVGTAQAAADSSCQQVSGMVRRGEAYDASFGAGLRFRLDPDRIPANPPGWTIRILGLEDLRHDFSMVATPPYRFWNPRYLDTSYGMDAARAVAIEERRFRFVLSDADYETAFRALGVLLWPGDRTEAAIQAARDTLDAAPTGSGLFHIVAATTRPATPGQPGGAIETLAFEATLCVPRGRDRLPGPMPTAASEYR